MKYRLTKIPPLKLAGGLASVYLVFCLAASPIYTIAAIAGPDYTAGKTATELMLSAIKGLISFSAAGFLVAVSYNLVSRWTGGIEIELQKND